MNQNERVEILEKAKVFFKDEIISRHINNTKKLSDPKNFNVNPFTQKYLSQFAFGDVTPKSIAKTMIYPRALGTSIATTFGNQLQLFCNRVLGSYASAVSGMDIEFIDAIDGRKKYCQIKSGPTTINFDDVETIKKHFDGVFNLARRNGLNIQMTDCVVGVFYGSRKELSSFYKMIDEKYPVYVGQEFWYRLTGDNDFYDDLIEAFAQLADDVNGVDLLDETIESLASKL